MEAITSFSPLGFDVYGKKHLESMIEHWPGKIIVYYETLPDFQHEKIEYRRYWDIPIWDNVTTGDRERILRGIPIIDGIIPGHPYNYNFDLVKFSKKVFVLYDAYQKAKDLFCWLDADTVATKDIPENFLNKLLSSAPVAYLGRKGFHTEAGFLGFKKCELMDMFFNEWRRPYIDNTVYQLKRWHDCETFDLALKTLDIKGNNLTESWTDNGTYNGLDVFPRSVVGKYFIHNKGKKKYA